ncbi:hypothetical protein AT6N2_C3281 [Agrobacterium tumefaciens]|nr:hypothetical protein AT6N2_C3281 [Agrobacterium tumefaciens]
MLPLSFPKIARRSDLANHDLFFRIDRQRVLQRQAETGGLDLKHVAFFRFDTFGEGKRCRAEHVHMHIARRTEQAVFEVVIFEVREGVGHVVLTRNERLFEDDLVAATNARGTTNIGRRCADADFGAETRRTQLGMGKVKIVDPLGDVIGKLVRHGKTDTHRFTLVGNDVDTRHLRFFAAIKREGWRGKRRTRCCRHMAVALVEPLRLHALFTGLRLAVFQTHAEHLHGVRQAFLGGFRRFLVHAVAGGGRTEMGKAGTGQMEMRRIGVGDRRQEATFGIRLFKIDGIAQAVRRNDVGEVLATIGRFHGKRINGRCALDCACLSAFFANRYDDVATGIFDL